MTALKEFISSRPKLAQMIGQALFYVGGLLVVAGVIGRAGLTAINAARAKSNLPAFGGVSEAYPQYVLWFVPQSLGGYVLPALLAGFGLYLGLSAKGVIKARRKPRRGSSPLLEGLFSASLLKSPLHRRPEKAQLCGCEVSWRSRSAVRHAW